MAPRRAPDCFYSPTSRFESCSRLELMERSNVSVAEDEVEDGDDLFEERYNAGVENGDIVD